MTAGRDLPRLHVVTDARVLERPDFLDAARDLLASQPPIVLHLRGGVGGRLLHDLATELLPAARAASALLFINDRIDVALTAGADGVQLGQGSLPVAIARELLPAPARIGASVHDADEAIAALGADFLMVGNIWETATHPGRPAAGTRQLRQVAAALPAPPLIAIGGVTPERVAEVRLAGAHGVAVLAGIWSAPSPSQAAFRYLEALSPDPLDPESGS